MPAAFPKKPPSPPNAVAVHAPPKTVATQVYLPEIIKGLGVSMRHFFTNTKEMVLGQRPDPTTERYSLGVSTVSYPEQKRPYPERFRGVHRLTTRDDGSVRCVACLCCSTACPAQCIFIEAGEYPEGDKRRGYERYPVKFVIDELRCIFCGFCVEACPCDAIRMDTGKHAVPYDSRDQFVYAKDQLLAFESYDGTKKTANPRHEPGDPTFPGLTRDHLQH
ncbi:MAG: NADH-quinone oxidoreductase subunit I [Polyangiaceae bacterium]